MAQITKQARLDNLPTLQDFISEQARQCLPESRIQQVLLATEEALVNIFSYAYPAEEGGEVTVICDCAKEKDTEFHICFEDRGTAFNILECDDPDLTLSLEERGIGGLGIFFIRQMIDDLDYQRKDGKNILRFTVRPR